MKSKVANHDVTPVNLSAEFKVNMNLTQHAFGFGLGVIA